MQIPRSALVSTVYGRIHIHIFNRILRKTHILVLQDGNIDGVAWLIKCVRAGDSVKPAVSLGEKLCS